MAPPASPTPAPINVPSAAFPASAPITAPPAAPPTVPMPRLRCCCVMSEQPASNTIAATSEATFLIESLLKATSGFGRARKATHEKLEHAVGRGQRTVIRTRLRPFDEFGDGLIAGWRRVRHAERRFRRARLLDLGQHMVDADDVALAEIHCRG